MIITLTVVIVILLASLIGVSSYFYNIAVASGPKDFLNDNPDLEVSSDMNLKYEGKEWLARTTFEDVTITSDDGLKLKGYYFEAKKPTNKTVIIAHGYSGVAKDMARFAKFYQEKLDYNVLMPDARGHGESEGNYIGFGWPERRDYQKWINYIIEKNGQDSEIVLHGVSMGGATVLMTSGEELPKQVKAIVEDCGYTSAEGVLKYQLKRMYNLPSFPIIGSTSAMTKLRAGYTFAEASALEQVKKAKLPILFIHGEDDTFVPVEMVHELYKAAKTEKELYLVPNAEHGNAYDANPATYEQKVTEFIGKYIQ
ncbi:alpha/beta hydrolase [Bacillus massiliigorillae]|uniref:alpha/beta hydrolase n=1 Tax=Bacillus massiliigorillae TaxID=1243664 RepID=UPI0005A7B28A|nr:alpha/beta hydrolase [Bacillus massiliigorillae]